MMVHHTSILHPSYIVVNALLVSVLNAHLCMMYDETQKIIPACERGQTVLSLDKKNIKIYFIFCYVLVYSYL